MTSTDSREHNVQSATKVKRLTKRAFWRQVITSSGRLLEVADVVIVVGDRFDTMTASNIKLPRGGITGVQRW